MKTLLANRGTFEMTVRARGCGDVWSFGWYGVGGASACARNRFRRSPTLHTFFRIVNCPPQPEDVWYSMPVGEIDFSECPRCTPSYRALPSGYPRLACTERSRLEQEVRSWRGGGGAKVCAW